MTQGSVRWSLAVFFLEMVNVTRWDIDCTPTFGFLKVSRGETIGVEESLKFKNYHDFEKTFKQYKKNQLNAGKLISANHIFFFFFFFKWKRAKAGRWAPVTLFFVVVVTFHCFLRKEKYYLIIHLP